jgi:hypothetical protein
MPSPSLHELDRRLSLVEKTEPAVVAERVSQLIRGLEEVKKEVVGLRKSFYALATSIAGGSLLFAVTMFALFK